MPEKPLLTGFMAYVKRPQSYAESINCNKINDLQIKYYNPLTVVI